MKSRIAFLLITILTLAFTLTGCKRTHEEIKDYEFAPKQETQVDDPADTTTETPADTPDETSVDNPDETGDQTGADGDTTDVDNPSDVQELENEDPEITFTISNLCGVDIGMISILDPYTAEQMDVGMLRDGLSIVITLQWPLDNTVFDFAVYNVNGDLVSTSEVDITGVQESVSIVLSGDGDLESVTSTIN
jgi:hypothetical protein